MGVAKKVKVVVCEHQSVFVDGVWRVAGDEFEVPAAEAKTLESQGSVRKAS